MYDYLIVGAGLYGSVFARRMLDAGRTCLVIEKRAHIGGNCYSEQVDGIHIHRYGAHIFHTNSQEVWTFVNRFATFNSYVHRVVAKHHGRFYSMPINLKTLRDFWGIPNAQEAAAKLQAVRVPCANPRNLEEWALAQMGPELYEAFIRGYTRKHWGRDPTQLPASILQRLPIRLTEDDRYFADRFQGVPVDGYTAMFERLLDGAKVCLGEDYLRRRDYWNRQARRIVYTGRLDEFFNCCYGPLEFRSLRFDCARRDVPVFQPWAVVNHPDAAEAFIRTVEHKHLAGGAVGSGEHTWITREYPAEPGEGPPLYPVNDERNLEQLRRYQQLAGRETQVVFGGRLAEFRYLDMGDAVAEAVLKTQPEFS